MYLGTETDGIDVEDTENTEPATLIPKIFEGNETRSNNIFTIPIFQTHTEYRRRKGRRICIKWAISKLTKVPKCIGYKRRKNKVKIQKIPLNGISRRLKVKPCVNGQYEDEFWHYRIIC